MSIVGAGFPEFRSIAVFGGVFFACMEKIKFMAWQTNLQARFRTFILLLNPSVGPLVICGYLKA